jgi:hypothetical protein
MVISRICTSQTAQSYFTILFLVRLRFYVSLNRTRGGPAPPDHTPTNSPTLKTTLRVNYSFSARMLDPVRKDKFHFSESIQ